jgi:hypothetical protein
MRIVVWASRLTGLLLLPLAVAMGVPPAAAQMGPSSLPSTTNPASVAGPPTMIGGPPQVKAPEQVPAALPGATPRQDRVAPAPVQQITDPTEALFDAINRGDIATARDAIDRGADLNGHNILGMTPLDLSVDLARNDITFLLLSLRNGDTRPRVAAPSRTAQGAAAAGTKPAATKPAPRAPAPSRAAAPPVAPQQLAADSGTPDAAAGFLGFGPAR